MCVDAEVAELTSRRRCTDLVPVRPRSVSPLLYRSSFKSRFDRPYSPYLTYTPSTSSLSKHRSIERLDRLSPVDLTPVRKSMVIYHSVCISVSVKERYLESFNKKMFLGLIGLYAFVVLPTGVSTQLMCGPFKSLYDFY